MAMQKKRKPPKPGRLLHIVILVISVLVIFEGKMLVSIFSKGGVQFKVASQLSELFTGAEFQTETETPELSSETEAVSSDNQKAAQTEAPAEAADSKSYAVVPAQDTPVDDTYFADATFIGDSRMEGFHMNSGLSQGTFLTGVGMTAENIFDTPFIATASGTSVTVFQALWNTKCKKFYILLGTNDLGTYDWESFEENYASIVKELRKMSSDALIYIIGVPYVEESKVTTGDYINNTNVDTLNDVLIHMAEKNDCYYLDINEVLSNGNHALIQDATSDGVHMYAEYCKIWLDYMKNHYVTDQLKADRAAVESEAAAHPQTEAQTSALQETESGSASEAESAAPETNENSLAPSAGVGINLT